MEQNDSIIDSLIEITFAEKDDFLKIRETLSRIGIASRKDKDCLLYTSPSPRD